MGDVQTKKSYHHGEHRDCDLEHYSLTKMVVWWNLPRDLHHQSYVRTELRLWRQSGFRTSSLEVEWIMRSYLQCMFESFAPETSLTLPSSLAALDAAIEAAVEAEGQGTMDILHEFVGCLNDASKSKRCTQHIRVR